MNVVACGMTEAHAGHRYAIADGTKGQVLECPGVVDAPRYAHDCDRCVFLGTYLPPGVYLTGCEPVADLYFCAQLPAAGPTVIARWSDDGPDYASGLGLVDQVPTLREARERARARGLL